MEKRFIEMKEEQLKLIRNGHFSKMLSSQDYSKIIKKREKFTDDLFPPNNTSLYSGKTDWGSFIIVR